MSIILTEAGWMRTAYKLARRFGGKIVTAGRSKHPKIVGLDAAGKQIKMTIPSSPSDNARTAKNVEAQLRRAGFVDRSKAAKVKDTLVKNTKVTALPASRKTANQQTTFKDFTQKYLPNVQGPRKPNTPVKRGKVQGPETELENRMKKAFDKRLDAVIKDVRGTKTKTPLPARMPKKLTDAEMEKLRNLKLTPKQRRKFRELGLLEQMVAPKKPGKRDLLNLTPSEKKLDAIIQLSNRPGVRRRLMTGKAMYPISEDNKHRDAKLNYQYKDVTNPKKPVDPIKALKLKKA